MAWHMGRSLLLVECCTSPTHVCSLPLHHCSIRTTYAKVAGKYQDVMTLEHSVTELHQMFLDFALLTEQQGELLDQIEFQVGQASDHVEVANEETYQAIEYQKAIRKKQWYGYPILD
jgi:t-SNARE complex subunit (syntaxin)